MKKQIILINLFTLLCFNAFAQINFEEGYFIDESDQKTNCLIKNYDWKNNPYDFEYKISKDSPVQQANINAVKEFGIIGTSKYIRAKVNIDRSSSLLNNLSAEQNPVFKEETLFLKVLIEGKASLFLFEDRGDLKRFFYRYKDTSITQLVFKDYLLGVGDDRIGTNNYFRQQLLNDFQSQGVTIRDIENIPYREKELMRFFTKINENTGSDFINYKIKEKKDLFNLSVRPGVNLSNLEVYQLDSEWNVEFESKINFRFGVEAEFILPFNKNKWSIILEPTYHYYSSEKRLSNGPLVVDYKSIELSLGLRDNFFLTDNSKIFINGLFVLDYPINSSITSISGNGGAVLYKLQLQSKPNYSFGIGYKYKDKFGAELRYYSYRDVLNMNTSWNSNYKTVSLILGYTLF